MQSQVVSWFVFIRGLLGGLACPGFRKSNCAGALFLVIPCLLAATPARADDDPAYLGQVTNVAFPPFAPGTFPGGTAVVYYLGAGTGPGQTIIVPNGRVAVNNLALAFTPGVTLSVTGRRLGNAIVANRLTFTVGFRANPGPGRLPPLRITSAVVRYGALAVPPATAPAGTYAAFTLSNGQSVYLVNNPLARISTTVTARLATGSRVQVTGVPQADGSIIATEID